MTKQGARRGDVPNEEDVREFMGTKMAWESLSKDLEALMRYRFLRDKDMVKTRLSSIRKTTLQVDVDILCCETFFVTDDRTEQVDVFAPQSQSVLGFSGL